MDMAVSNKIDDIDHRAVESSEDIVFENKELSVKRSVPSIYPGFVENENISKKKSKSEFSNPSCDQLMKEMLGKYKINEAVKVSTSKSIPLQEHKMNLRDTRIEEEVNRNGVVKLPKESGDSKIATMKPQATNPRIKINQEDTNQVLSRIKNHQIWYQK